MNDSGVSTATTPTAAAAAAAAAAVAAAMAGATVAGQKIGGAGAGNILMALNAHNLSAMIMKGSPQSSERDAGFCSGSSEGGDDLSLDHGRLDRSGPTSPAESSSSSSSQDFVDVVSMVRNKRKSAEPAKVVEELVRKTRQPAAPPKKRIRYSSTADSAVALTPPAVATPPPTAVPPMLRMDVAEQCAVRRSPSPAAQFSPSASAATPSELAPRSPIDVTTPAPQPRLWNPFHYMPNPAHVFVRHPGVTTLHRPFTTPPTTVAPPLEVEPETEIDVVGGEQAEPLNLVVDRSSRPTTEEVLATTPPRKPLISVRKLACEQDSTSRGAQQQQAMYQTPIAAAALSPLIMTPTHNATHSNGVARPRRPSTAAADDDSNPPAARPLSDFIPAALCHRLELMPKMAGSDHDSSSCASSSTSSSGGGGRPQQRNYKNMTRERRIEANARERTRVHTISAAYETLRRSVPSYSDAQKLSKLSVLRIACTYIMALGRMTGEDYSADQSQPSVEECWEAVTRTIQNEGKLQKKRKDGQDDDDDDDE